MQSDHPHACGENVAPNAARMTAAGPSPRVWGERVVRVATVAPLRTIPTRVGRTHSAAENIPHVADHPHACGENRGVSERTEPNRGPSPRVWGELATLPFRQRATGPSPRVWGERRGRKRFDCASRTIPTRVGRTLCQKNGFLTGADHPHACGENKPFSVMSRNVRGPSPRVWGEPTRDCTPVKRLRTIPTRVGRTKGHHMAKRLVTDHPHACGENETRFQAVASSPGPSPRVWGEPPSAPCGESGERTIPTRVGRTKRTAANQFDCTDHPHACGENTWLKNMGARSAGPSPRVWGEPLSGGL